MTNAAHGEPITEQVQALLAGILRQADFAGSDELLRQVAGLSVVGGPITMLDLGVAQSAAPSAFADGLAPLSVIVSDAAGTDVGELLLWVERGQLSALEFAWWTDDPPDRLPAPGQVRVARK